MRREDEDEPVAAGKCLADFIVPLLGPDDACPTVPDRNPVLSQNVAESLHNAPVSCGVRQEDFSRQRALFSSHSASAHASYASRVKALAMRLLISAGLSFA